MNEAFEKSLEWGDRIPLGIIYRSKRLPYEQKLIVLKIGPLFQKIAFNWKNEKNHQRIHCLIKKPWGVCRDYRAHLIEGLNLVPDGQTVAVVCSVGNRYSLASSILQRAGRREVFNVLGGVMAWQKADYQIIGTDS